VPFISIIFSAREFNCKLVYYESRSGGQTATSSLDFTAPHPAKEPEGRQMFSPPLAHGATDRTLFFRFSLFRSDLGPGGAVSKRRLALSTPFPDRCFLRSPAANSFLRKRAQDRRSPCRRFAGRSGSTDTFESMEKLAANIWRELQTRFSPHSYVCQVNKRDLPNACPPPDLIKALHKKN